ncbi:MAG: response regulator transcription factor [Lachnospiraceae bacterium]|nr:response regulator transcription factor [Lachnospiraceae bacterium]
MMCQKILIVEDEKPITDILRYGFQREGFQAERVYTGADGLRRAKESSPDLMILDWMLPDVSGLTVCRMLTETCSIPIIMLTAKESVEDKLRGLEAGADDYIAKPFDVREVVARARTVLRRAQRARGKNAEERPETCGNGITLRRRERMVAQDGAEVELTPREYELLVCFLEHPRMVFTREMLLEQVWGCEYPGDTRTVDIHVQRLRKKLKLQEALQTVYGVGYKYVDGPGK